LRLFATILLASAALCHAADKAAGRWEGVAQIPGQELKLIVETPIVGGERQFNIGAIFSAPLVMNGTVYFGGTDGNLYRID
jgi:hypothetical protein